MQTVIIVIHLMIVSVLIGAVLLQKSEGGGLGMGGGAGFMSSRGTANLLTRTTAILAAAFFLTSLLLSWLAGVDRKPASILGTAPATQSQPGGATPIAPPTSRRRARYAARRSEQQQQAPVRPAGAAFAIKQGGHAGRRLPSCIRTSHQCSEIALDFTSPTARQNVRLRHAIRFGESGRWP